MESKAISAGLDGDRRGLIEIEPAFGE